MVNSSFHMIDVGAKAITSRQAQAQGRIELSREAFTALRDRTNPKGDVLALAEVAGLMSAKRTSDTLPLCHPLPIEKISLGFRLQPEASSVLVYCDVHVTAKTGAEMEALAGVNGALLCIYDLSKAVNPVLKISDIRLNFKRGGKSGAWFHPEYVEVGSAKEQESDLKNADQEANVQLPLVGLSFALLTVSDRVSQGMSEDVSGELMKEILLGAGGQVVAQRVVSDDKTAIMKAYHSLMSETSARVILSTGGTGLGPRDVTPEALVSCCDRLIPGFGELLRAKGAEHIQTSWLSRSTAGIKFDKILIALPGSPKAVREGLEVLLPLLRHGLHTLNGGSHEVS